MCGKFFKHLKLSQKLMIFYVSTTSILITTSVAIHLFYLKNSLPGWLYVVTSGLELLVLFQVAWWFVCRHVPSSRPHYSIDSNQDIKNELKHKINELKHYVESTTSNACNNPHCDNELFTQASETLESLQNLFDSILEIVDILEHETEELHSQKLVSQNPLG